MAALMCVFKHNGRWPHCLSKYCDVISVLKFAFWPFGENLIQYIRAYVLSNIPFKSWLVKPYEDRLITVLVKFWFSLSTMLCCLWIFCVMWCSCDHGWRMGFWRVSWAFDQIFWLILLYLHCTPEASVEV